MRIHKISNISQYIRKARVKASTMDSFGLCDPAGLGGFSCDPEVAEASAVPPSEKKSKLLNIGILKS